MSGQLPDLDEMVSFAVDNGAQAGPFAMRAIIDTIRLGQRDPNTLVWWAGEADWVPFSSVSGLMTLLQDAPTDQLPPPPEPVAPEPLEELMPEQALSESAAGDDSSLSIETAESAGVEVGAGNAMGMAGLAAGAAATGAIVGQAVEPATDAVAEAVEPATEAMGAVVDTAAPDAAISDIVTEPLADTPDALAEPVEALAEPAEVFDPATLGGDTPVGTVSVDSGLLVDSSASEAVVDAVEPAGLTGDVLDDGWVDHSNVVADADPNAETPGDGSTIAADLAGAATVGSDDAAGKVVTETTDPSTSRWGTFSNTEVASDPDPVAEPESAPAAAPTEPEPASATDDDEGTGGISGLFGAGTAAVAGTAAAGAAVVGASMPEPIVDPIQPVVNDPVGGFAASPDADSAANEGGEADAVVELEPDPAPLQADPETVSDLPDPPITSPVDDDPSTWAAAPAPVVSNDPPPPATDAEPTSDTPDNVSPLESVGAQIEALGAEPIPGAPASIDDEDLEAHFADMVRASWAHWKRVDWANRLDDVLVGAVITSALENGNALIDIDSDGRNHFVRFENTTDGSRTTMALNHLTPSPTEGEVLGHHARVVIGWGQRVVDASAAVSAVKDEMKSAMVQSAEPGTVTVEADVASGYAYTQVDLIWAIEDYVNRDWTVDHVALGRSMAAATHSLRKYWLGRFQAA